MKEGFVPDIANKALVLAGRFKLSKKEAEGMVETGRLAWLEVYDIPTLAEVKAKVKERHEFTKRIERIRRKK